MELQHIIEKAWDNRDLLNEKDVQIAIKTVIADLDNGKVRVAEPTSDGSCKVNYWVKNAVILYFPIQKMRTIEVGPTVGSCAQIGKNVHLSGGVGIGGVLEPIQAAPVIIEDGAFIGSRAIIVEGVRIGKEAVIGAGVTLTASSKIIDVTGDEPVEHKGYVPERSVVIPGSLNKKFNAGEFQVPCALIIGKRKASTDLKTSLNDALRDNSVAV